jgi:hypothetical protein
MFTGAAVLTTALAVPAHGQVIVDDSFADGNLAQTGALDTDWWTGSSSSALEIVPGTLGMVTGTSGRSIHTVFPAVTLDNPRGAGPQGDKLVVTYTFTTPATVGNRSTAFRVGLYDSLGRPALDNNVSASSGSPNAEYGWGIGTGGPGTLTLPGVMMDMDVNNGATSDLNFREHLFNTITGTGRLQATTSGFANISPSGPDIGDVVAPNTTYTGSLTIERITATEFEYTGVFDIYTYSNIDSTIDSDVFDFLGFHVNSNTFGSTNQQGQPDNGLDFSNVKIEFIPVPEPSTAALGLVGGLLMLKRRK